MDFGLLNDGSNEDFNNGFVEHKGGGVDARTVAHNQYRVDRATQRY
jgi:hypothetical protein